MNIEDYEKENAEHKIIFSDFVNDLRAKLADLMSSEASSLQRMLDNYQEEENNIKAICKTLASQTVQLKARLRRVEAVRSGWEVVKRRLQAYKGRLQQQSSEMKGSLDRIHQKCLEHQQQLQNEETELTESHQAELNKRASHGVEFQLVEATNTLVITIKNRRFELVYDKGQDKWSIKDGNYQLNKAVGEFNLHSDAVQLIATLRYIAAQPI